MSFRDFQLVRVIFFAISSVASHEFPGYPTHASHIFFRSPVSRVTSFRESRVSAIWMFCKSQVSTISSFCESRVSATSSFCERRELTVEINSFIRFIGDNRGGESTFKWLHPSLAGEGPRTPQIPPFTWGVAPTTHEFPRSWSFCELRVSAISSFCES